MTESLAEKTDQYERMLAEGIAVATISPRDGSPLAALAAEHREMAESYLHDGRHFRDQSDLPNALAAFAYGHGWLDAAVRSGLLDVPDDADVFAI